MLHVRSTRWPRLVTIALLGILLHGPAARAQEGDDRAPEQPEPPAKSVGPQQGQDAGEATIRARWEARLSAEIERVDQTCRLTALQKKKLELAGRGDIKRCFDGAHNSGSNPAEDNTVRNRLEEGLFRDSSMFAKTLPRALDSNQLARYRAERRERRRRIHRARVDVVVALLDETAGFTAEQRERLAKRLMERTRLSTQPDEDVVIVLAQAAALQESELRPIFDDSQWRALSRMLKTMDQELKDQLRRAVLEPDDTADWVVVDKVVPATQKK